MAAVAPREDADATCVGIGWTRVDTFCVIALALFTSFAHPIALMLHRPYWLDEEWVAVLTRVGWSRSMALTSSSPVGWVALVRLVPGSSLQRARMLVLVFSMASERGRVRPCARSCVAIA